MRTVHTVVSTLIVLSGVLGARFAAAQDFKPVRADLQAAPVRRNAPDFALKDATGKTVRLSDYRGRVVLLDFWATSCAGCVQEIPMFVEIAKAYPRLAAIGVSEDIPYNDLKSPDEAWARVKPFVRERAITYPIVMSDALVDTAYNITALPLTHLIDARGRIAATYVGVVERASLEANLRILLAESR